MERVPTILTAVLTVPSILYLSIRCALIFFGKWRTLRHHVRRGGGIALAIHVGGGMALLGTTPFLARLCVPQDEDRDDAGDGETIVRRHGFWLAGISFALVSINASVFLLLPHPDRHEEYKTTRRIMVRCLGFNYAMPIQLACMASSCAAFLFGDDALAAATLLLVSLMYATSLWICYCELRGVAWENGTWAKYFFRELLGNGPSARSTFVANAVRGLEKDDASSKAIYAILLSIGTIAGVQSVMQCRRFLFPDLWSPPDPGLEDFFVVYILYSTVVMSASVFSFSQYDPNATSRTVVTLDLFLGQMLPLLITGLGPYWMASSHSESSSATPFPLQWMLWTRTLPHGYS